uniref:Uncharacterized protein n=1 Tax=Anguilla anguilla TaxID=7936 RepID=A0A0E9QVN3_ANGAN
MPFIYREREIYISLTYVTMRLQEKTRTDHKTALQDSQRRLKQLF